MTEAVAAATVAPAMVPAGARRVNEYIMGAE